MIDLKKLNIKKNKTKLIICNLFIIIFLLDIFYELKIFKDNFFYSGNAIFSDLLVIIPNLDEFSNWSFFDIEKKSSNEMFNRIMNYPLIWTYIFNFLSYFGDPILIFGIIELTLYVIFANLILLQVNKNFYIYLFLLFSPPILLMLERGNIDCFIFFLLLAGTLMRNYISGFLTGFAISLKYYPILLLPMYFIFNNINKKFIMGFLLTLPLIILTFLQVKIMLATTPVSFSSSFGIYSFALFLIKSTEIFKIINLDKNNFYLFYLISFFIFFISSFLFNHLFKKDIFKIIWVLKEKNKDFQLFIIFSFLSLMIFLVFSNFPYRIVFLLPSAIIYLKNLEKVNKYFDLKKKIFYFSLATGPFFAPWIISTFNSNLILLNYYSWAFYSPIVFVSFVFYFVILYNFLRLKLNQINFNF